MAGAELGNNAVISGHYFCQGQHIHLTQTNNATILETSSESILDWNYVMPYLFFSL